MINLLAKATYYAVVGLTTAFILLGIFGNIFPTLGI